MCKLNLRLITKQMYFMFKNYDLNMHRYPAIQYKHTKCNENATFCHPFISKKTNKYTMSKESDCKVTLHSVWCSNDSL